MGIHLCVLLFLQIVWCSFTGAYPTNNVKVSMSSVILHDILPLHPNGVIQSIWLQEPARSCNTEIPPETILTDKLFLQFNFVPYLCVILYDTSRRYLNISHGNSEINSNITQEIIKGFLPDTFCQKMKDNEWLTTIEETKPWVSNFNRDMKNSNSCLRYCVSDVVNPLCAYALWLDSRIKQMGHEFPSVKVQESRPPQSILQSREQVGSLGRKQPEISNTLKSETPSSRLHLYSGEKISGVLAKGQSSAVTSGLFKNPTIPKQIPAEEHHIASGQRQYSSEKAAYADQTISKIQVEGHLGTRNEHENSEQIKTGNAAPNDASLPIPASIPDIGKTNNPSVSPTHKPLEEDSNLPQISKQLDKSVEHHLVQKPESKGNEERPGLLGSDKQSVSETIPIENTKPSGAALTVIPSHNAEEAAPNIPKSADVANSHPVGQGEDHAVGQQASGEHRTSTNLVGGYESINGGHSDASKIDSPADSPKPQDPEASKKPEPLEDKTDKERVNTTDPGNDTNEVSGTTKGESTETKLPPDQIERSGPEAANQAVEGENDGRVISGEPNDHEEQNAMDGAAESQAENGDSLGGHGGGDQPQDSDREEASILDQDFATEGHRYNEGDDEIPPRSDGSTKLSNNNNNIDYVGVSDEDDSLWPGVEQPKIPQNDADGGYAHDRFVDAEDSHFFAYFMTMIVLCIIGYLIFHNKQKILALALEGRARKGTRRRPSTSGYRKLDSNLEEAVTSSCTGSSVTHVIY